MPDTMIRNVPSEQHQRIQDIARQRDVTQNEIYLEVIAAYCAANDPQVCIGWLEINRSGDIDSWEDCPECGYKLDANPPMFIAVMADGSVYGPVCNVCATSS